MAQNKEIYLDNAATTYCNGEKFDPTGIVVTAQLYNGNTEIAEELTVDASKDINAFSSDNPV